MKKYPGLIRRNGSFQVRKRLPEDVRRLMTSNPDLWRSLSMNPGAPLYEWRRLCDRSGNVSAEVSRSLGEATTKSVVGKYHAAAAEIERFFSSVRRTFQPFTETAPDLRLREMAREFLDSADRDAAAAFADIRLSSADRQNAADNIRDDMATYGTQDDPVVIASFVGTAEGLLRELRFSSDEPALSTLAGYLRDARLDVLTRSLKRAEGQGRDLVEISLPPTSTGVAQSVTLKQAFERYRRIKSEIVSSPKTKQKYDYLWRLLSDFFPPDLAIESITRDDLSRFGDTLKRLPPNWTKRAELAGLRVVAAADLATSLGLPGTAPNTYNGYLMHLTAFYRWADENDLVHKNLAKRLVVASRRTGRRSRRLPFDIGDLRLLFGQDYHSLARFHGSTKSPASPDFAPTDARFWVPLISLFTGMRLNEICQLTATDIVLVGGVTCIVAQWDDDLDDEHDDGVVRSLKTEAAHRTIPVVKELENIGFPDFVFSIREKGGHRLFPDLKPDKHGYVAAPVSRWFNRHKTTVGIADHRKVFHSLRHTFRDAMRNAEVSRDVVIQMGGWAKRDQSDDYGTAKIIVQAKRELDRIGYPGLNLSHLYRTQLR
jgi:integrase